jgi:hypothetical protein
MVQISFGEERGVMSESFYKAFLAIILIPYSLVFLMLVWNMFGPSMRARRKPEPEYKPDPADDPGAKPCA